MSLACWELHLSAALMQCLGGRGSVSALLFIENSNEGCVVIAGEPRVHNVDMARNPRADAWVPSCLFTSSLIVQLTFDDFGVL